MVGDMEPVALKVVVREGDTECAKEAVAVPVSVEGVRE